MLSALLHFFSEDLVLFFSFASHFNLHFYLSAKKFQNQPKKLDVATDAEFVFSFVDVDFIIFDVGTSRIYNRKQILPNISPLDGGFISLEIKFSLEASVFFESRKMKFPMR